MNDFTNKSNLNLNNLDKLKEYDPKGYSEFERYNNLEDDYSV